MSDKEILSTNSALQTEGSELLKYFKILNSLKRYGQIDIGGSFVYGTMVDRDIDIAILTPKLSLKNRTNIIDTMLKKSYVSRLNMVDYVNFPREDRGSTIWIGLTIPFKGNNWNIDLIMAEPGSADVHTNMKLHKDLLKLTEDQRLDLLKLKHQTLKAGTKIKGVTSIDIYKKYLKIK